MQCDPQKSIFYHSVILLVLLFAFLLFSAHFSHLFLIDLFNLQSPLLIFLSNQIIYPSFPLLVEVTLSHLSLFILLTVFFSLSLLFKPTNIVAHIVCTHSVQLYLCLHFFSYSPLLQIFSLSLSKSFYPLPLLFRLSAFKCRTLCLNLARSV